MTQATQTLDAGPWYREPWPWIIMAGPAIVIVAGIVTAWIAWSGADGLVSDDYYKQGLAINRVIERSESAASRGLSGELVVDAAGVLTLRLVQTAADAPPLPHAVRVRLVHPARQSDDRVLEATRTPEGTYTARASLPGGLQWQAVVDTPEWRLEGQLPATGSPAPMTAK